MLLWWISLRAISSTTEFNLLQPPNLASQQMGGGLWSVEAILCMAAMACPGVTSPAASRAVPWPSHWAGVQLSGWEMQTHTNTHNTLAIPWGEAKSFAGREALALCVIALASYSRQLAGRWTGNMLCWTKLQPWLQKPNYSLVNLPHAAVHLLSRMKDAAGRPSALPLSYCI